MAAKTGSNKKKRGNKDVDEYLETFRYKKGNGDTDSFKTISIYRDNGPIRNGNGWNVEFEWWDHSKPYEEDIFELMALNKLERIHGFVMGNFRAWGSDFIGEIMTRARVENDIRYRVKDTILQQNEHYYITRIGSGDQLLYLSNYRDALDLYVGRRINVFQSIEEERIVYADDEEYYFSNYDDQPITLVSHGKNKSLFYLCKQRLNKYWDDIWALSLKTAKRELKSANQGYKYYRKFQAPKCALERLDKVKKNEIEFVHGSRTKKTFVIRLEETVELFGGQYFKRIDGDDIYFVGKDREKSIQVEFTINGKQISFSALVLKEDKEQCIHGLDE
eukprot:187495_1